MSINFSEDAQQEVVTSSRVLPEDTARASNVPAYRAAITVRKRQKKIIR